jgi:nicotinate-nucleotide--dimethylbenzimidazole phosphoribosyltransferase
MSDMLSLAADVDWPDNDAASAARATLASAPADSGRLGELAEWLAGVQGCYPPRDFARVRVVVFGVAPTAPEMSPPPEAVAELVGAGIRAIACSDQPVEQAIEAGAALADAEVDTGADLVIVALQGPDAGTPSLALVSVLTNTEPVKVLPRGTQLAADEWMRQAVAVRDARRLAMPHRSEPAALLDAIGGSDLAVAAGFVLRCAGRRTPVLLDGLPAVTAALVAYEAQPRAVRWWNCADLSAEPAHELALSKLGKRAVLDLGTGLGDGTAGLLAVPVLRAAVSVLGRLAATVAVPSTGPDGASVEPDWDDAPPA